MGLFDGLKKKKEMAYLETISSTDCLTQNFEMRIDDIFNLPSKGTVVIGLITAGACRVGENAYILKANGERLDTTITNIETRLAKRPPNNCAYKNEHAGIGLRGISKAQLGKGDLLIVENVY